MPVIRDPAQVQDVDFLEAPCMQCVFGCNESLVGCHQEHERNGSAKPGVSSGSCCEDCHLSVLRPCCCMGDMEA